MKCNYTLEDINSYYDGGFTTDEREKICRHLEECKDCQVYYHSLVHIGNHCETDVKLNFDVSEKVLTSIDKNRYHNNKILFSFIRWADRLKPVLKTASAAAAIIILAIFISQYSGKFSGDSNPSVAGPAAALETTVPPMSDATSVPQEVHTINTNSTNYLKVKLVSPDKPYSEKQLNEVKSILLHRFESIGYPDCEFTVDAEKGSLDLQVNLDNSKEIKKDNYDKLTYIFVDGKITLQEIDESKVDSEGVYLPTEKIIVNSSEIVEASLKVKGDKSDILIKFNDGASARFEEATSRLIGKRIGLFLDGKLLMAPTANDKITDGRVIISGNGEEDLKMLVAVINSGALPVHMNVSEFSNLNNVDSNKDTK
ncbi:MAG: hypothetical protein N2645_03990 [Clostridia bacterium]|nr:hypothetical protein [Clostridia bacterium]